MLAVRWMVRRKIRCFQNSFQKEYYEMKKQNPVQKFHHGGENTDRIQYDFSVSLNPLGIPACAVRAMDADRSSFEDYPDTNCSALRERLSELLELPAGQIICGAGAVDLIYRLPAALDLKKVLLYYPSFPEYERALRMHGTEICGLFSRAENDFAPEDEFLSADRDADAVIISDPDSFGFHTRAVHTGNDVDKETGAVKRPITMANS